MKLTKSHIKQLIKEEMQHMLQERLTNPCDPFGASCERLLKEQTAKFESEGYRVVAGPNQPYGSSAHVPKKIKADYGIDIPKLLKWIEQGSAPSQEELDAMLASLGTADVATCNLPTTIIPNIGMVAIRAAPLMRCPQQFNKQRVDLNLVLEFPFQGDGGGVVLYKGK
jgi:hypothetical protein